jgi:hypothetical protein
MTYPANKGMRCQKWQRVPGRGGRRLLRCKQFAYPPRRFQMGFRPGHVPANYGATCLRRKRVWSPWWNKQVWRCAKFGPGQRRRPYRAPTIKRLFLLPPGGSAGRPVKPPKVPPRLPPGSVIITPPPGRIPLTFTALEKRVAGRTPVLKPQQLTFGPVTRRRRRGRGAAQQLKLRF